MRAWIDVAVLAKSKNLNGRLVVRATAGFPFLIEEGCEVAFVPPQTDAPRNAVVETVDLIGDSSAEVVFAGVDGDAARMLVGCHCLMRRSGLDSSLFEEEPAMWDGWRVIDVTAGEIGTVSGLVDNPGQMLLEVLRANGATVLVPAVDEIVLEVSPEEGVVRTDLPKGLLDL